MLPDLRLLLVATISTFFVTVGAGIFAAVRLPVEPMIVRAEQLDDSPIQRISLSWPEPGAAASRDFALLARRHPDLAAAGARAIPIEQRLRVTAYAPLEFVDVVRPRPRPKFVKRHHVKRRPVAQRTDRWSNTNYRRSPFDLIPDWQSRSQ